MRHDPDERVSSRWRGRAFRRLRKRCEERISGLTLPVPFNVRAMCEQIAAERGRPIHLLPMTAHPGLYGLWLPAETSDTIFYADSTTPPHQDHIILHELCHLLCDHHAGSGDLAAVLPDLDPGMIRRILARTIYSAAKEQEAELLATLISQRTGHAPPPTRGHTSTAVRPGSLAARLTAALDWSSDAVPLLPAGPDPPDSGGRQG